MKQKGFAFFFSGERPHSCVWEEATHLGGRLGALLKVSRQKGLTQSTM